MAASCRSRSGLLSARRHWDIRSSCGPSSGVDVSRRKLSSAGVATLVGLALMMPTSASADVSSFPPPVDAIVHGDLTEYQWMLPAVNATEAHSEATGAGVTISVIDTGVDAAHPDLEGRIVEGAAVRRNATTGKFELVAAPLEQTSDDWFFHGTHVAGIIAADDDGNGVTGIAPEANIMPIHTFPRRSSMSDVTFWNLIADSIDFSVAEGVDVINMSLGGPSSAIVPSNRTQKYLDALGEVCQAVGRANDAGTVVVASAGNEGDYGNPESVPGSCSGTFTVAAMAPSFARTYWSSFDASVDVIAPGENILSADSTVADTSQTPHVFASGTSMSSPVVAGVAALVIEEHPGWSPEQVEDQITSTAKDLGVTGRDPYYGWGLVDAAAAVGAAASSPAPQNFFATWSQPSWGAKNDEGVVSWFTPDVDPVTGYTVTVYTDTDVTNYDVDGNSVRADVVLPRGSWYTVTAHIASGDVTSYPASADDNGAGAQPKRLTGTSLQRQRDTMILRWDAPVDPTTIDVVRASVVLGDRSVERKLTIDQSQPFPTEMRVRMPRDGRWQDAYAYLLLIDKDDSGRPIGARWMRVKGGSPAMYGTRVQSVDRAGRTMVEVTGAVSDMNSRRVCGKSRCAGESAVLIVDRGRSNERFHVVFTQRGVFHQLVGVDRGTDAVRVRVVGPKRLDSGPLVRVKVGDGGAICRSAATDQARGC